MFKPTPPLSLAVDIGDDDGDDDNTYAQSARTVPAAAVALLPSRDGQVPVSVQPARVAGWAANFSSPVFSSAIFHAADGNDDHDVDGESARASGRYLSDETRAALFAGLGLDKDSSADSTDAKDKGGDGGSLAARLRALLDEAADPFPPLSHDESCRSMMEGVSAAAAASLDDLRARYLASSSSSSLSANADADAIDAFRSAAADATIEIGSISVDDLAAEERRIEELRVAMLQGELDRHMRRKRDLARRESDARTRILALRDEVGADLLRRQQQLDARQRGALKRQQQAFRKAETRLAAALALRHGRLAHTFGELRSEQQLQEQDEAEGAGAGGGEGKGRSEWMPLLAASSSSSGKTLLLQHHGTSSSSASSSPSQPHSHPSHPSHPNAALALPTRRFQIDWSLAPRTVCIRLDCLRALKNKVPGGRYVMLVTLHDRLGGAALRWSQLHGIRWSGSTPHPQRHGGRFGDTDLSFAQKRNRVFVALPAEAHTRPSMCLVFELFLCRGRHSKTDRVVAWGAFPICTGAGDGSLIAGTFKTPLLRGPVDARVCKFEQMERAVADDLDQWLCNLYFSVRHLPRYASGEKEYTVELSVTSNVLRLSQRADADGVDSGEDEGGGGNDDDDDERAALLRAAETLPHAPKRMPTLNISLSAAADDDRNDHRGSSEAHAFEPLSDDDDDTDSDFASDDDNEPPPPPVSGSVASSSPLHRRGHAGGPKSTASSSSHLSAAVTSATRRRGAAATHLTSSFRDRAASLASQSALSSGPSALSAASLRALTASTALTGGLGSARRHGTGAGTGTGTGGMFSFGKASAGGGALESDRKSNASFRSAAASRVAPSPLNAAAAAASRFPPDSALPHSHQQHQHQHQRHDDGGDDEPNEWAGLTRDRDEFSHAAAERALRDLLSGGANGNGRNGNDNSVRTLYRQHQRSVFEDGDANANAIENAATNSRSFEHYRVRLISQ